MELDELSPDDPRAYVRLAVLLRDGIASGEWKPGKPVPSITALSQQYGHARPTCSKAMKLLVNGKLLVRVPGMGITCAGMRWSCCATSGDAAGLA